MSQITSKQQAGILIMSIEGPLAENDIIQDLDAQKDQFINECVSVQRLPIIILNLEKATFINAIGLGALISLFTKIKNYNGMVYFVNPPEKIQSLFVITKLTNILNVCTLEEALKQAKNLGKE